MSQELPLTVSDLAEIRAGEENHEKVLEVYQVYESPKLETYLNLVAANIAKVSSRSHLPYHITILNDDEVNCFGGPGGYIYVTRGFLDFVQSESEIAGAFAHEIGHIAGHDYTVIPHQSKLSMLYKGMVKGTELARDSIGTYGTAAHYGVRAIETAKPYVVQRFGKDQEVVADERAIGYVLEAGYDPREYQDFLNRLASVDVKDVIRFVNYMHTHPPFPERRRIVDGRIGGMNFESGKIEFKADTLNEARQVAYNAPVVHVPRSGENGTIIFEPQFGLTHSDPSEIDSAMKSKDEKFSQPKRRLAIL